MFKEKYKEYLIKFINSHPLDNNVVYASNMTYKETIFFRRLKNQELLTAFDDNKKRKKILKEIINNWGGIKGFRDLLLVKMTIKSLEGECLISKESSRKISSISKALSFYDPQKYFILDTRVAFLLNTIILVNKFRERLIPMPVYISQSKKLKEGYSFFCKKYKSKGFEKYYDISEAYFYYCNLIKIIHRKSKYRKDDPEIVEMILFKQAELIKNKKPVNFKM